MSNLFILLLVPVVAAAVLAFVRNVPAARWAALVFSLVQVGLTVPFLCHFLPDGGMQFEQNWTWIASLGIRFHIGMDGISLPLVLLTNGIVPMIVLTTFSKTFRGNFYALVSFMQAGLLLVFLAQDAFLFYVGWEAALIPIYFICAIWGEGDRIRVNLKFFVYTFSGSLLMLLAILYLYNQVPSRDFEWTSFAALDLSETTQRWMFWAFFIAFAIKIPILPFHTWQPDTYTNAPAAGTMLLSGIMLKMGVYGLIRWLLPVAPFGVLAYSDVAMVLCVAGVVYASVIAFRQRDAKRLVAYSSIAHVGLISAGVFSWQVEGMQGAIVQMLNHGLSVVGLFLVIDILENRTGTRLLDDLGGLAKPMPRLAIAFLVILMGAVGLPLTNGFIGEFLLLKGVYGYGIWYAVFGGLTLILGAVYMLRFYRKAMFGSLTDRSLTSGDVKGTDLLVLAVIVFFVLFLGILPGTVLHLSEPSVVDLLNQIKF